jgi:hypothetical protein
VQCWLDELSAVVEAKNVYGLVQMFRKIVPEYMPSPEMLGLCELDRHDIALAYRRAGRQLWQSAMTVGYRDSRTVPQPLDSTTTIKLERA